MSENKTADQAREEWIAVMGAALGAEFSALWQDVANLHFKWHEFVELYGTIADRVGLLNRAAPSFFGFIQQALFENIMLHIARLTDRPTVAGKKNLTVNTLPDLVPSNIGSKFVNHVAMANSESEFCRDHRHRRIAHSDHALALGLPNAAPLQTASRQKVRNALTAISAVLNGIEDYFGLSPTAFQHTIPALGGAKSLLHVLETGLSSSDSL